MITKDLEIIANLLRDFYDTEEVLIQTVCDNYDRILIETSFAETLAWERTSNRLVKLK